MILVKADIELVRYKNMYAAKKRDKIITTNENQQEKNVSKAVAIFMFSFAILWCPTYIGIILKQFYSSSTDDLLLSNTNNNNYNNNNNIFIGLIIFKQLSHTLSYLTPIINPIVNINLFL